jgi:G:T/U-mismatch repair DNA glycosylase
VAGFIRKVERYRPAWIAFHGKEAARQYLRGATGRRDDMRLGQQAWQVAGSAVFVLPSASAANRDPRRLEGKPSRLAWFRALRADIELRFGSSHADDDSAPATWSLDGDAAR